LGQLIQGLSVQTNSINLLAFGADHLEDAVRLSRQANWPHRLEDWKMALDLSEGLVAVDSGDRVIGTVLVTPFKADTATINMVIVDEAVRGRGLGRRLMHAALSMAGARRTRLTATREGLPLYERLGFHATDEVLQHQGLAVGLRAPGGVDPAGAADLPAIAKLDGQAFGADRERLIAYIAGVGRFAVIRRGNRPAAFAGLRAFGRGEVIGPVVAPSLDEAKALIAHFISERPGAFLRVDTTANTGLAPWLAEQGLALADSGIAMQRPLVPVSTKPSISIFALANQAFG
jgi:GNAT superfamily N-acetyltransferase